MNFILTVLWTIANLKQKHVFKYDLKIVKIAEKINDGSYFLMYLAAAIMSSKENGIG